MRHTRARRRFKATLVLLLVIAISLFFESSIEAFAPEFKNLAEIKIGDIFEKKLDISIGAIDGGIIRPFTFRNVAILKKGAKASNQLLDIKAVVSNYRIWDFFFSKILAKTPHVAIDFSTKNKEVSGFITVKGNVKKVLINGYVRLFDGEKIEIKGGIKNGVARFLLSPNTGFLKIEYNFAADGVALIKITAKHIKIREFDVIGEAVIRNVVVNNAVDDHGISLEGDIEAKNLILNYKPFFDIKASYRISKGFLEVSNFDIGRFCCINGKFGLKEPYLIDAVAVTDNVNLNQALCIFNPRYTSFLGGTMNSKWEFKGPAANIRSKVHLEVRKGAISEMNFDFLNATLKGDGPMVRIEDSRIMRESGYLILAGEMDMRKVGKDSLFENIKITDGEKAIMWDSWDTAKWQDVREFRMTKKVIGDFNVGFKKFINDEKIDESLRDKDQFELEYNLHPNDSLKLRFVDNASFVGLEHKDKF